MSKLIAMATVLAALILAAPPAQAECSKNAHASVGAWISYKMKSFDSVRSDRVLLETIYRTGYYGGGCKTAVGRQKARHRACSAAVEAAQQKYDNNLQAQMERVCSGVILKGKDKKGKFISERVQDLEVDWIQIDRVRIHTGAQDSSKCQKGKREVKLTSRRERFFCKGGKPVLRK